MIFKFNERIRFTWNESIYITISIKNFLYHMIYNMIFLMVLFHYARHLYFYSFIFEEVQNVIFKLIKEYDSVVKKGIWFTWKESVYNINCNRRNSFTIWITIRFSSWFLFHYAHHHYFCLSLLQWCCNISSW
jgi:hypothetical protein